jgi:adenylate cyclase
MCRFLRFLADWHLDGKDSQLKESVIAVEVFGRKPDHDPSQDSIVRTEAGRLRARLAEYYLGEGKDDPIVIELPKGGYTPAFRCREPKPESPARAGKTRRRIRLIVPAASLLVALGVLMWYQSQYLSTPIAIAVLPLENLSHDPGSDYFADGLTDELIRNLSLIEGLSPRSQTSSFAFKGRPRNVREVEESWKRIISLKVPSCGLATSCASTYNWFVFATISLYGQHAMTEGLRTSSPFRTRSPGAS